MKTPINAWILGKIVNYLCREGCMPAHDLKDTVEGMMVEIVDAFGFRYEISIKTIARKDSDDTLTYDHAGNAKISNFQKE